MAIFIKKLVNRVFSILYEDALPELRASYKFKVFILAVMGILGFVAVWALIYYP